MRSVFVAIPSHSGTLTVGTFMSLIQSMKDLDGLGINMVVQTWVGDSLISHARNALVAKFMTTECTDLLFIDADIAWETGGLLRLLHWDVDFVAGIYRFKSDDENYPLRIFPDQEDFWSLDPKTMEPAEPGLIRVAGVPTGFCRLRRQAIEKMMAAMEDKQYFHKCAPEIPCHLLFDIKFEPPPPGEKYGRYAGEDYTFCDLWTSLGENVWLDPEIKLTHIGHKDYPGHLGAWLRNRNKPVEMVDVAKIREVFSHPDYEKLVADTMPAEIAA